MIREQEPPFAIQIEPTEGCTLACSFCALQSIRDNGADSVAGVHGAGKGPYKFMTVDTATAIAYEMRRLKWNARVEFAMHGEPTVNPELHRIINVFREALPKASLMVTSNGSGVMKEYQMDKLFEAGLNTLALDNYKHAHFLERMKPWFAAWSKKSGVQSFRYPSNKDASPHTRFYGKRVVVIADIASTSTGNHQLTNQGGNSGGAGEHVPLNRRCAKPFRELSIRWDGSVALCCDDWKGEYKVGNVNQERLNVIWNHPRFRAARVALYNRDRGAINVCSKCNVKTYRDGLLPDKMGKQDMPVLDKLYRLDIADAQRGKVFSIKPV